MAEEKDEIVDLFNSAFKDFEADVDDKVWKNIEKELHPESKKKFVWWHWAAAASLIGGVSILALLNLQSDKEQLADQTLKSGEITKSQEEMVSPETLQINNKAADQTADQKENNKQIEDGVQDGLRIDAVKEKELADTKDVEYSGSSKTNLVISSVNTDVGNTITNDTQAELTNNLAENLGSTPSIQDSVAEIAAFINEDISVIDTMPILIAMSITDLDPNAKPNDVGDSGLTLLPIDTALVVIREPIIISKPEESKWLLAANFCSAAGYASSSQAGSGNFDNSSGSSTVTLSSTSSTTQFLPAQTQTSVQPEFGKILYSPPLITSITVNLRLANRWSVESGLSYTVLHSRRETAIISLEQTKLDARLQYFGVPMVVKFDVLTGKKLTWYTSLGAMVEKGLNVRYTTIQLYDGEAVDEVRESYPLRGVDLSVILGMGLDYNINGLLSYYLQPGLSGYFVNDGSQYNPRSSRILWPNVQTGLRVHL